MFSSNLPSDNKESISAGWNDPPPSIADPSQLDRSRITSLQRQRRPIDPSILGSNLVADNFSPSIAARFHQPSQQPSLHGSESANHLFLSPDQNGPPLLNLHSSHSFPELHSMMNQTGVDHQHNLISKETNAQLTQSSLQQRSFDMNSNARMQFQSPLGSSSLDAQHHSIHQQQHQMANSGNISSAIGNNSLNSNGNHPMKNLGIIDQTNCHSDVRHNFSASENQGLTFESDQQSIIFSPPNAVYSDVGHRPSTQPDPNNYRPPIKAAGDVSLSGPQLATFLMKATLKLHQGPTREGIQLRIGQFNDLARQGQVSDACLKKLNFVVDAVDREVYDEAWQFFEQLQTAYSTELATGWGHGIRILIQELKKGVSIPNYPANLNPRFH